MESEQEQAGLAEEIVEDEMVYSEYIGDQAVLEKNYIATKLGEEDIIDVLLKEGDNSYRRTFTQSLFDVVVTSEKKNFGYVSNQQQEAVNIELDKILQKYNLTIPILKYTLLQYGDAYENKLNALISRKISGDDRFYVPSKKVQDFTTYTDFSDLTDEKDE